MLGTGAGVLVLLLCVGTGICCFCCRKRRKARTQNNTPNEVEAKTAEEKAGRENKFTTPTTIPGCSGVSPQLPTHLDNLPAHFFLAKDNNLRENAKKVSENVAELENEFKRMLGHVKENILKKTTVSSHEKNLIHNRYKDIVPYDDNYIALKSPLFQDPPETNYVNASRIKFPGIEQAFIASQAPQPESFAHFWQMVVEEEVEVIVMVTQLVEGKKVKAHQYWPDREGTTINLKGDAKVELTATSFQGDYHIRKFSLVSSKGNPRTVTQMQMIVWPDLGAPDQARKLVDMVQKVEKLHADKTTPILVHCSAGVGRTGTFLALYKLWNDYNNPQVASLSLLPTVVALRTQRCLMVQKAVQYAYVAKCLSFMVSTEEGDYYEATGERKETGSRCDDSD